MAEQGERSQPKGPPKAGDKGQQGGAKGEPQQAPRGQSKEKGKEQAPAGDAKPAPKQGDPQAGDKNAPGEDKPAPKNAEQPGQISKPKDDRLQGDAQKKPSDELRREDVEDVAKDLRSDDPQKREQAREKLEDVQRKTQDGEARQAAEDALKKDDEQKASTKSAPKSSQDPDKKDGKQGEQSADSKDGGQKDGAKPGAGKDGGTKQDVTKQGDGKGQGPKSGGDKNVAKHGDDDKEPPSEKGLKKWLDQAAKGMQKKDGDPKPSDEEVANQLAKTIQDLQSNDPKRREQAKGLLKELTRNAKAKKDGDPKGDPKGPPQKPVPENLKKELEKLARDLKGNDPKRRKQAEEALKELSQLGRNGNFTGGKAPQTEVPGKMPDKTASDGRHRERAGELQLDKLDPKQLRKLIKDTGLTEEQVREAIEYQRKQDAAKSDPSKPTPGSGKPLPTTGPDRFKPGDDKGPKIDSTNEGQPPVELRPAVKDLAKRLSELDKGKSSKDK